MGWLSWLSGKVGAGIIMSLLLGVAVAGIIVILVLNVFVVLIAAL